MNSVNILLVLLSFVGFSWCANTSCYSNEQCSCIQSMFSSANSVIVCKNIPMLQLPVGDLPNGTVAADRFEVTGSGLQSLGNDAFGSGKTRVLILDENSIFFISNNTFLNMSKTLEEISLNDNNLYRIPWETLLPLEALRILKLNGNKISSVLVDWSSLRNTLTQLYLSNNNVDSLPLNPAESLSNLNALNEIHLANNLLTSLEVNAFPYSLKSLNASGNYIKYFPHDLLNRLQDLTKLDLSHNQMETIPSYKYDGKINLNKLDLSYNTLVEIKKPFSKAVKILTLNLSANKIMSIEKEAFSGLDCRDIDLSFNKLATLNGSTFSGLESTLENLDLSQNRFVNVPYGLKDLKHFNLKSLSLARNNIPKLKNSFYNFGGLQELSVSGNAISIFPTDALGPLRSLTVLDLSYNKIAEIFKSDFKIWGKNLEKLYMESNSLFYLGNSTFDYTPKLTELRLSYNTIGDIYLNAFKNLDHIERFEISFGLKGYGFPTPILSMKSLGYLALDNNNINSMSSELTKLESIKTLILDFNRIKDIDTSTFDSKAHKFLKDLRLSFNFIAKLDSNLFSGLNDLQNIGLHHNQIYKIADFSFKNLPGNLSIFLSNNKIEKIDKDAFFLLPNLKKLDLHSNNLQTFDYNIFNNVTSKDNPMTLNLSRNRIDTLKVPDYERNPVYIDILDISHNKISKIPEKIVEIQTSLKHLNLGYNEINSLESQDFYSMVALESLTLIHNKIVSTKFDSFQSLEKLHMLNLSHNHIEKLDPGVFKNLVNLRILDLSFNNIGSFEKDTFLINGVKLESLYLSNNKITTIPTEFGEFGQSLRLLDLSYNQLVNLDINFPKYLPKLLELNLSYNKLTNDSLIVFKNVTTLIKIDLSGNIHLGTYLIPKDVFSNSTQLRYLNLARTGLQMFPPLFLPNLVHLNVAENKIKYLVESFFSGLPNLRDLVLRNNNISELNGIRWIQIPSLKNLDLSHNPIKVLDKPSFFGLYNLRKLDIQNLNQLEHMDSEIFVDLEKLVSLKIDFKRKAVLNLNTTLSHLKFLTDLSLLVMDTRFSNELPDELSKKLQSLEITGKQLRGIDIDSLKSLKAYRDFKLHITGTGITHFPKHFMSPLKNKGLTLDLTNNELHHIGPEILFKTYGDIRRSGTKAFPGGIDVRGNPLECGCEMKWFAEWLRRYLVETLNTNNLSVEKRLEIIENMNELTCYDKKTQQKVPVLTYDLTSDELLCGIVLNFPKSKNSISTATSLGNVNIILVVSLYHVGLFVYKYFN